MRRFCKSGSLQTLILEPFTANYRNRFSSDQYFKGLDELLFRTLICIERRSFSKTCHQAN
jgi:hypothetical protein